MHILLHHPVNRVSMMEYWENVKVGVKMRENQNMIVLNVLY